MQQKYREISSTAKYKSFIKDTKILSEYRVAAMPGLMNSMEVWSA